MLYDLRFNYQNQFNPRIVLLLQKIWKAKSLRTLSFLDKNIFVEYPQYTSTNRYKRLKLLRISRSNAETMLGSQMLKSSKLFGLSSSLIVASVRSFSSTSTVSNSALSQHLKDPSLTNWPDESPVGESNFSVFDPASPTTILAEVSTRDPKTAIEKCSEALPSWRDETTASHRASLLTKWSTLITENSDDLATIMTMESGKPLAESHGEVNYAKSFLDYYAAEAIRPGGAGGGLMIPSPFQGAHGGPKGQSMVLHQAVGVSAMVVPWNFPLAMITRKVGPAFAAGCTAVVKPSELTPLSAIALKNLADRAGIPDGVFELV